MRGEISSVQTVFVPCDASRTGRHSLTCVFAIEDREPRIKKEEYQRLPILVHISSDCADWRAAKAAIALGSQHSCVVTALAIKYAVEAIAVDGIVTRRVAGQRSVSDVEAGIPESLRGTIKQALRRVDHLHRQRLGASGEAALAMRRARLKANPRGVRKPWAPPQAKQNTLLWTLFRFVQRNGRSQVRTDNPRDAEVLERRTASWETRFDKDKTKIEICLRTRDGGESAPVIARDHVPGARWAVNAAVVENHIWKLGRVPVNRTGSAYACAFCDARYEYSRSQDITRHFESAKHKKATMEVLNRLVDKLNTFGGRK